jgi:hypothetical protein
MTFIQDSTQKARKNHSCCACRHTIPKGFTYVRSLCADNDGVQTDKWHTECREQFNNDLYEMGDDEGDPHLTWEHDLPDTLKVKYGIKQEPQDVEGE